MTNEAMFFVPIELCKLIMRVARELIIESRIRD